MKDTNRYIALALCLSLTLGAFVYRPPEAKAVALVDDAAIVTSVIVAVMVYGGYRFLLNNIEAGAISDIIKPKVKQWNYEHGTSAEDPYSGFAEWSAGGMDNFRKSITPGPGNSGPDMKGLSWLLAGALFEKVCEFVEWLGKELGVQSGVEEPVPIVSAGNSLKLSNGESIVLGSCVSPDSADLKFYDPGSILFTVVQDMYHNFENYSWLYTFDNGLSLKLFLAQAGKPVVNAELRDSKGALIGSNNRDSTFNRPLFFWSVMSYDAVGLAVASDGNTIVPIMRSCSEDWNPGKWVGSSSQPGYWCKGLTLDYLSSYVPSATLALPDKWAPVLPAEGAESVPMVIPGATPAEALDVDALAQEILKRLSQNELEVKPSGSQIVDPGTQPDPKPSINPGTDTEGLGLFGWLKRIWKSIVALPAQISEKIGAFFTTLWGWLQSIIDAITALPAAIAEKVGALFRPDESLLTEITDTFKGKFGFFSTLKQFGNDLFGMTPETEPPVIWVHLENAESKFGYNYGDKQKIFDMTWYQKYKASVDGLLSGFLWLGYLWLLFKRAPSILNGMQLSNDEARASADVSSAPRLGSGDGFYLGGKRE